MTPAWTRVSAGRDRRYLVWINSAGSVLLFSVPSLQVAPSSVLSTVSVEPLARIDLPFATVGLATTMRALVPQGMCEAFVVRASLIGCHKDDGPLMLSLIDKHTCFTVAIEIPSESGRYTPPPRMHLFPRKLPLIPHSQQLHLINCSFDPTGTLGVYFAQGTKQPGVAKLWAVAACFDEEPYTPDSEIGMRLSRSSSSSLVSTASSMFSTKSPPSCRSSVAYVKTQVGTSVLGSFEHVVFDEVSGLVCARVTQIVQPNEPQVRECRVLYHPELVVCDQ